MVILRNLWIVSVIVLFVMAIVVPYSVTKTLLMIAFVIVITGGLPVFLGRGRDGEKKN